MDNASILPAAATLTLAAFAFVIAGLVKGAVGLGLPTVAIGVLGLAMPLAEAAALLVVPALLTNIWQAAAGPWLATVLRRTWPMLAGIVAGTAAGAQWFGGMEHAWAARGLGIALIAYAVVGLAAPPIAVPRRAQALAGPAVGVLTGIVTALTGVFVLPAVPYLQGLGMHKDELVQALGVSFTVSTLALAGVLAGSGLTGSSLAFSLLALVPAALGMAAGQRLRRAMRPESFRRWLFACLFALGVAQLVA